MFTGIVERKGIIREWDLQQEWGRIAVEATGWSRPVELGESIAVQGICLTAAKVEGDLLRFDVLAETFHRTNLGEKGVGDHVNLERSLRWGDPMGGHIVVGHIDGIGRVRKIDRMGRDWSFEIACAPELMDGIVFKGSVGCDGVSLTVAELKEDAFVVDIIPFTYEVTTFGDLKDGDAINLEIDLLSKFVRRYVERGVGFQGVTWDSLRESGLVEEVPEKDEG